MPNQIENTSRLISGTFGELWIDNQLVGECYGLQLKVTFDKEDVQLPGRIMKDTKLKSAKGTGTVKYYKVNSRFAEIVGDKMLKGIDSRFTLISALKDPDAYGYERVCVRGASFDDLVLADWEAGSIIKHDSPLTFTSWEYLDRIAV